LLTGQLTRLKIHPPSGVARIWCEEGAQNYMKLFIAHKITRNNTSTRFNYYIAATELPQPLSQNTNMFGEAKKVAVRLCSSKAN